MANLFLYFFFFNDTATTEIYTLSLHDALPIYRGRAAAPGDRRDDRHPARGPAPRSEEHTSELQSQSNLVCRLLLEKKKKQERKSQPLTRTYHVSVTTPISDNSPGRTPETLLLY